MHSSNDKMPFFLMINVFSIALCFYAIASTTSLRYIRKIISVLLMYRVNVFFYICSVLINKFLMGYFELI